MPLLSRRAAVAQLQLCKLAFPPFESFGSLRRRRGRSFHDLIAGLHASEKRNNRGLCLCAVRGSSSVRYSYAYKRNRGAQHRLARRRRLAKKKNPNTNL